MSGNGQLTAGELVTVQGTIQLSVKTARAWAAARAANPSLRIATPAGGYRSLAVQRDMKARPWAYNLNPESGAAIAAVGRSSHGYGTAVDVVGDLHWMIQNGPRFGFSRPLWNDPNHFVHDGVTAVSGSGTPVSDEQKDDDMPSPYGFELIPGSTPPAWQITYEGKTWPAMDVRTGKPLNEAQILAVIQYAEKLPPIYAGGRGGACALSADQATVIHAALTPPQTPANGGSVPGDVATKADLEAVEARLVAQIPPAVIVEQKKPGN